LKQTKDLKTVNILIETCYTLLNESINQKKNTLLYKNFVELGGFHAISDCITRFEKEYTDNLERMVQKNSFLNFLERCSGCYGKIFIHWRKGFGSFT
jgi:hypothetical protein